MNGGVDVKKQWTDEEKKAAFERMKGEMILLEEMKRQVSEAVKQLIGDYKPPHRTIPSKWDREQALINAEHDAWWDEYQRTRTDNDF